MNGADTPKTGSSEHPIWVVKPTNSSSPSFGCAYGLPH